MAIVVSKAVGDKWTVAKSKGIGGNTISNHNTRQAAINKARRVADKNEKIKAQYATKRGFEIVRQGNGDGSGGSSLFGF